MRDFAEDESSDEESEEDDEPPKNELMARLDNLVMWEAATMNGALTT